MLNPFFHPFNPVRFPFSSGTNVFVSRHSDTDIRECIFCCTQSLFEALCSSGNHCKTFFGPRSCAMSWVPITNCNPCNYSLCLSFSLSLFLSPRRISNKRSSGNLSAFSLPLSLSLSLWCDLFLHAAETKQTRLTKELAPFSSSPPSSEWVADWMLLLPLTDWQYACEKGRKKGNPLTDSAKRLHSFLRGSQNWRPWDSAGGQKGRTSNHDSPGVSAQRVLQQSRQLGISVGRLSFVLWALLGKGTDHLSKHKQTLVDVDSLRRSLSARLGLFDAFRTRQVD